MVVSGVTEKGGSRPKRSLGSRVSVLVGKLPHTYRPVLPEVLELHLPVLSAGRRGDVRTREGGSGPRTFYTGGTFRQRLFRCTTELVLSAVFAPGNTKLQSTPS